MKTVSTKDVVPYRRILVSLGFACGVLIGATVSFAQTGDEGAPANQLEIPEFSFHSEEGALTGEEPWYRRLRSLMQEGTVQGEFYPDETAEYETEAERSEDD